MAASFLKIGFNVDSAMNSIRSLSTSYNKNMSKMATTSKAVSSQISMANKAMSMSFNGVNAAVLAAGNRMRWYGLASSLALAQIMRVNTQFEFSMRRVKAILGLNEDQFADLRKEALRLGRVTEHTAKAVAESMGNLAIAGFRMNEIMAVMPSMLAMATAGNVSLAFAAESAAGILRAFTKDAEQMNSVAGVLASTFTTTNTTLESITNSLRYVAPIANKTGVELEEVAAAVGLLGDAGVRGSMAGTSLRMTFLRLAKGLGTDIGPKVFSMAKAIELLKARMAEGQGIALDSNAIFEESGEGFKRLDKVVRHLNDVFGDMAKEQQNAYLTAIVGARAATGMMALLSRGATELGINMRNALFGGIKNTLQQSGQLFASYTKRIQDFGENVKALGGDFSNVSKRAEELLIGKEIPWNVRIKFEEDGQKFDLTRRELQRKIFQNQAQGIDTEKLNKALNISALTLGDVQVIQNRINQELATFTSKTGEATVKHKEFVNSALRGMSEASQVVRKYRKDNTDTFTDMTMQTTKAAASFNVLVGILKSETDKANAHLETLTEDEKIGALTQNTDAIYSAYISRIQALSEKFLGIRNDTLMEAIKLEENVNKPLKQVVETIEQQVDGFKEMGQASQEALRDEFIIRMADAQDKVYQALGKTVSRQKINEKAIERVDDVLSGHVTTLTGYTRNILSMNSALDIQAEQLSSLQGQFLILKSAVTNSMIAVGAALSPLFISVSEFLVTIQNNVEELRATGSNVVTSFTTAIGRAFTGFEKGTRMVDGMKKAFGALQNDVQRAVYFITLFGAALLPIGAAMIALSKTSSMVVGSLTGIMKIIPLLTVGIAPMLAIAASLVALKLAWDDNLGGIRRIIENFKVGTVGAVDTIKNRIMGLVMVWKMLSAQKSLNQILATEDIAARFNNNREAIIKVYEVLLKVRVTIRDVILEFKQLGSSGNKQVQKIVEQMKSFYEIMKQVVKIMLQAVKAIWEFAAAHPQMVKFAVLFFMLAGPIRFVWGLLQSLNKTVSTMFMSMQDGIGKNIGRLSKLGKAGNVALSGMAANAMVARSAFERLFISTGSALANYVNFMPGRFAIGFTQAIGKGLKTLPKSIPVGINLVALNPIRGFFEGVKSGLGGMFNSIFKGRGITSIQANLTEQLGAYRRGFGEAAKELTEFKIGKANALRAVDPLRQAVRDISQQAADSSKSFTTVSQRSGGMMAGVGDQARIYEQMRKGRLFDLNLEKSMERQAGKVYHEFRNQQGSLLNLREQEQALIRKYNEQKLQLQERIKLQDKLTERVKHYNKQITDRRGIRGAVGRAFRPFRVDRLVTRDLISMKRFGVVFEDINKTAKQFNLLKTPQQLTAFQKTYPMMVRYGQATGRISKGIQNVGLWLDKTKVRFAAWKTSLMGVSKNSVAAMTQMFNAMSKFQKVTFVLGAVITAFMMFPPIIKGIIDGFKGVNSQLDKTQNNLTYLKDVFKGFLEGFNAGWKDAMKIVRAFAELIGVVIRTVVSMINRLTKSLFGANKELGRLGSIVSQDTTKIIGYAAAFLMVASALRQTLAITKSLFAFGIAKSGLGILFKGMGAAAGATTVGALAKTGAKLSWIQKLMLGINKFVFGKPVMGVTRLGLGFSKVGRSLRTSTGLMKSLSGLARLLAGTLGKVFIVTAVIVTLFDGLKGIWKGFQNGVGVWKSLLLGVLSIVNGIVQTLFMLLKVTLWLPKKVLGMIPGMKKYVSAFDDMFKKVEQGAEDLLVNNPLKKFSEEAAEAAQEAMEKSAGANKEIISKMQDEMRQLLSGAAAIKKEMETKAAAGEEPFKNMVANSQEAFKRYEEIARITEFVSKMMADTESPLSAEQLHMIATPFKVIKEEIGELNEALKNAAGDANKTYETFKRFAGVDLSTMKDAIAGVRETKALESLGRVGSAAAPVAAQVGKVSSLESEGQAALVDQLAKTKEAIMNRGAQVDVGGLVTGPLKQAADRMNLGVESARQGRDVIDAKLLPSAALASGGLITRPTMGLVGEAGPEIVAPLEKFMEMAQKVAVGQFTNASGQIVENLSKTAVPVGRAAASVAAPELDINQLRDAMVGSQLDLVGKMEGLSEGASSTLSSLPRVFEKMSAPGQDMNRVYSEVDSQLGMVGAKAEGFYSVLDLIKNNADDSFESVGLVTRRVKESVSDFENNMNMSVNNARGAFGGISGTMADVRYSVGSSLEGVNTATRRMSEGVDGFGSNVQNAGAAASGVMYGVSEAAVKMEETIGGSLGSVNAVAKEIGDNANNFSESIKTIGNTTGKVFTGVSSAANEMKVSIQESMVGIDKIIQDVGSSATVLKENVTKTNENMQTSARKIGDEVGRPALSFAGDSFGAAFKEIAGANKVVSEGINEFGRVGRSVQDITDNVGRNSGASEMSATANRTLGNTIAAAVQGSQTTGVGDALTGAVDNLRQSNVLPSRGSMGATGSQEIKVDVNSPVSVQITEKMDKAELHREIVEAFSRRLSEDLQLT